MPTPSRAVEGVGESGVDKRVLVETGSNTEVVSKRMSMCEELTFLREELVRTNARLRERERELRISNILQENMDKTINKLKTDLNTWEKRAFNFKVRQGAVLDYAKLLERLESGPSHLSTTFIIKNLSC